MRKLLAIFAISAMLFSCGSQDSYPTPAGLKNETIRISPFDTLVVEFTASIADIDKLTKDDNVIISDNVEWLQEKSEGNKFMFIGKNTTPKGTPFFNDEASDKIIFKNLPNAVSPLTLNFSTIRIIGNIDYKNIDESSAKDLTPFFSATKNNIEFAGVLDHKLEGSKYNMEDYYKVSVRMNDTLKIEANAKDAISIKLIEPDKNSVNKTFSVKKGSTKKFEYIVGSGHLDLDKEPPDPANKMVDFYIIVSDINSTAPPNSYTLSLSVLR